MNMYKKGVCFYIFLFILLSGSFCEEYNLYGEAGQAYAVEVNIGHPHQKLNVIVDTGSTTLAIASYPRQDNDKYFYSKNSTSVYETGTVVHAKYSQGMWVGKLVSDFVQFTSLPKVPEVRTDIGLITKSYNFFMNGSGWQGLLGLAYLPVGARGENVVVESWLDSLDRTVTTPTSFELKLCGPMNAYNATHYGRFRLIDDDPSTNINKTYHTPILRKRWYEIGVISVSVLSNTTKAQNHVMDNWTEKSGEMCKQLNAEKSILDSGTTNIRLPDALFRQVVDELKYAEQKSNGLILDEFWYHGEAACWPEPREWSLPWLAVDILSADSDEQYFTLEIPSQNYMRVVTARNSSSDRDTVSEYCYKLGLEAGGKETVLGYTAMEGYQVTFNRSAGWIGFQTSNCGPDSRISGPYNASISLVNFCHLTTPLPDTALSIKTAQWALCVISIVAGCVLIYLLAPCIKMMLFRNRPTTQISLSHAALFEHES